MAILNTYVLCNALTLVAYYDPEATFKVALAYIFLSLMIWSSIFTFFMNLFGWNKSG